MDKLTKRGKTQHENGICCTHFRGKECEIRNGNCTEDCPWEEAVWSKLAEYEDLEEQGLLLRLPCKIGDTVYNLKWWDDKTEKVKVDGKTYCRTVRKNKVSKSTFNLIDISSFGKDVFLTKEEAEQALKKMEGGAEE